MRRNTRRKGTSKRSYKRSYKRTSKRSYKKAYKRVTRKQSGGEWVDMKQMNTIVKQRSNASALAAISAEKAKKVSEYINHLNSDL